MTFKLEIGYKVASKSPTIGNSTVFFSTTVDYNPAALDYIIGQPCFPLAGTPIFLFSTFEFAKSYCVKNQVILRVEYLPYRIQNIRLVLPTIGLRKAAILNFWKDRIESAIDIEKSYNYNTAVPNGTIYAEYVVPLEKVY